MPLSIRLPVGWLFKSKDLSVTSGCCCFAMDHGFEFHVRTHHFSNLKMAATIKDSEDQIAKRAAPKPILLSKLEGCSDVVNMAVAIPHEDAIISVSDDR